MIDDMAVKIVMSNALGISYVELLPLFCKGCLQDIEARVDGVTSDADPPKQIQVRRITRG